MPKDKSKKILLVYKKGERQAKELATEIFSWLDTRNISALTEEAGEWHGAASNNISLAIVLGGDGTILGVARHLVNTSIPLLGINFGRVGYLAIASPEDWQSHVTESLKPDPPQFSCVALAWALERHNATIEQGVAVNDIVVGRGSLARLLNIDVWVDEERLRVVRSDGLIVSTPIGSTGYNVSAGGPVVSPVLAALLLTPICPFHSSILPLVFSAQTRLCLGLPPASPDAYLTIDGQLGCSLQPGDKISFQALPGAVAFSGSIQDFTRRLKSSRLIFENCTST